MELSPVDMENVPKLNKDDIVQGKYRIIDFLGAGGLAYNYLAVPVQGTRKLMVIKQTKRVQKITKDVSEDRFQMEREFRLLTELEHDKIPQVYEMFEENRVLYSVREFREGVLLEDLIKKGMSRFQIDKISLQLFDVLEYLHKKGIIYRDLKPSNVLVDKNNNIFLFDFGTARFHKPGKKDDTIALGTPGFAAPEQYGKSQTTWASDIYSFGAVLYYMITKENPEDRPFEIGKPENLKAKIKDPATVEFLTKCFAFDPAARYQNVKEARERFTKEILNPFHVIRYRGIIDFLKLPTTPMINAIAFILISFIVLPVLFLMFEAYSQNVNQDAYYRQHKDDLIKIYIERGYEAGKRGDYEEAVRYQNRALEIDPNSQEALLQRGAANLRMQQYNEAIADFDRVISLNPNTGTAYLEKGIALQYLDRHMEAVREFTRAIEIDNSGEARLQRSFSHLYIGDYDKAVSDYRLCRLQLPKDERVPMLQAMLYVEEGEYDKAMTLLNESAISLNMSESSFMTRKRIFVLVNRGWVNIFLGKPELAEEDLRKALSLDKNNDRIYNGLALVRIMQGRLDSALYFIENTPGTKGRNSPEGSFIRALYSKHNNENKSVVAENLQAMVDNDPYGHFYRYFKTASQAAPDEQIRKEFSELFDLMETRKIKTGRKNNFLVLRYFKRVVDC
jgi:serine/threonine protein kinase